MGIANILKEVNPDIIIFLSTVLIAFISWLVNSLIAKPLIETKSTFTRYFDKRIEILSEIKSRLNLIAYFPSETDSLEFKNELQLLLKDGKAAYLSKDVYDNVLKISITPYTNETQLLKTI